MLVYRLVQVDLLAKVLFYIKVNMIYLGTISDRIPIIPPFAPDHHICGIYIFVAASNFLNLFFSPLCWASTVWRSVQSH